MENCFDVGNLENNLCRLLYVGLQETKKKKKFRKLFSSDLQQSEWENADYSVVTINLQCFILQHKFAAF